MNRRMNGRIRKLIVGCAVLAVAIGFLATSSALAQVSPSEIRNPKLSATEGRYLPELQSLQRAIGQAQFRLPFVLTRYVGVDPSRQASLDTRGLEFVYFQNRMLLKTSGFYSAAFNAQELTTNERASRTFQEVIVPILRLVTEQMPQDVACDGIGFEIAYHTRDVRRNSDYEGREILAVVMDRSDAFAYVSEPGSERQQAILNRSQIYLDAKPFGLAPGRKDPFDPEELEGSGTAETVSAGPPAASASVTSRLINAFGRTTTNAPSATSATASGRGASSAGGPTAGAAEPKPAASQADAEKLQEQYQSQLDAVIEDGERFHLVSYAPPSFVVDHRQLALQLTLRNTQAFDRNASSIYKRAAQSFDLFLAPQLKALVRMLPADRQLDALDFSVLNRLGSGKENSESIDFVCPVKAIRSFVEDEITSQDLIDQSLVLVNGVRIHLNLEISE
jgi:hypothetical protein